MTVVSGYLQMLLREQGGPLNEKQRKMLEEADRSCTRIGTLVSEMSDLGRLEGGDLKLSGPEFDLSALIAELATGMPEGEDRGIRLETRGIDRPVMVSGDRTRLAAALRVLMHAALRDRADPGVIIAECSTSTISNQSWAVVAIGAEPVARSLADAAASIPAFDEWRGGLGLALPVGRRVIEAHGGAVWSAPGNPPRAGSALRLPLAKKQDSSVRIPGVPEIHR